MFVVFFFLNFPLLFKLLFTCFFFFLINGSDLMARNEGSTENAKNHKLPLPWVAKISNSKLEMLLANFHHFVPVVWSMCNLSRAFSWIYCV